MSVTKFQREIWSKSIQDDLEERCQLVKDCTRKYEGDCEYAKTVRILAVGDPTITPYTGNKDLNYEEMTDSSQNLDIDVQNSFSFMVKDVDKAQSQPGLPERYQKKAVHGLALKREKFIGALVAGKAQNTEHEDAGDDVYKEGATTVITATNRTQEAIKAAFDDAIDTLKENNYEDPGIMEMGPRVYRLFKDELIDLKTANDDLIKRGVVGKYDDYEVKSTNNIYKDGNYEYEIVRSREAIAFAGQINEVEAGRMEKRFSDYVRGLDTFGAKIISQKELVCVKVPLVAIA